MVLNATHYHQQRPSLQPALRRWYRGRVPGLVAGGLLRERPRDRPRQRWLHAHRPEAVDVARRTKYSCMRVFEREWECGIGMGYAGYPMDC